MIKAILFDLGNVLLPLDVPATYKAFEALGARPTLHKDLDFFHQWEKGEIGSDLFYDEIRAHLKYNTHASSIASAWNKMLLPFPAETLFLLKKLKSKYKLVLISNINHEHEKAIKKLMGPFDYADLLKQFSGIYYSHHVGLRKPQPEFFLRAIKESKLVAEETLFIDDTEENIDCAEKLGFKTWHFKPEKDDILQVKSLLKKLNKV